MISYGICLSLCDLLCLFLEAILTNSNSNNKTQTYNQRIKNKTK